MILQLFLLHFSNWRRQRSDFIEPLLELSIGTAEAKDDNILIKENS
jgi:hypothetical protein